MDEAIFRRQKTVRIGDRFVLDWEVKGLSNEEKAVYYEKMKIEDLVLEQPTEDEAEIPAAQGLEPPIVEQRHTDEHSGGPSQRLSIDERLASIMATQASLVSEVGYLAQGQREMAQFLRDFAYHQGYTAAGTSFPSDDMQHDAPDDYMQ